jgi:predicted transcriptional regulator
MADKRFVLCLREEGSSRFKDLNYIKQTFYGKDFYMASQLTAKHLAQAEDLNGTDIKVLLYLLSQIDFDNLAMVTQSHIAREMNVKQSQVSKALKKLEELMYIDKRNVGGNNAYYIEPFVAKKGTVKKEKSNASGLDEIEPIQGSCPA